MKTVTRDDILSMGASFNGAAIHLESLQGFSISAFWTDAGASLEGTLTIQGSNNAFMDNTGNQENPSAVWDDLPGFLAIVDGSGSFFWNIADVYFKAARIKWERAAGSGTLTAYIYAKGWV